MAYDTGLAERLRKMLSRRKNIREQKMFGGLCYLQNGNMACGIVKNELMVRVGPDKHAEYLAEKYARPMDFTGRPMKGMLFVQPKGIEDNADLKKWVNRALDFVKNLPAK